MKIILSIRYSKNADFIPVSMGRRMVVFFVGEVGKCCGRPKCLGGFYEAKAESDLTKTRNS